MARWCARTKPDGFGDRFTLLDTTPTKESWFPNFPKV
jgi:hypothetical protein